MSFLIYLSDYIIPFLFLYIIGFGLLMKVEVYDEFVKGAKDGFQTVIGIMPTLIGLMVAVGVLRASGALNLLSDVMSPFTKLMYFPSELVPVVLVKMFSSSAATGLMLDIFKEYGPDSHLGRLVSVLMSSTETIFYTMSVYYMAAGVKKSRYTLIGALVAMFTSVVASVVITNLIF